MDLFASLFFSPGHCSRSFFFSATDGATHAEAMDGRESGSATDGATLIVGADHHGRPEVRESGSATDGATLIVGAEHRVGPHMLKF
jgi:hypothetical protein